MFELLLFLLRPQEAGNTGEHATRLRVLVCTQSEAGRVRGMEGEGEGRVRGMEGEGGGRREGGRLKKKRGRGFFPSLTGTGGPAGLVQYCHLQEGG